jgi:ABC-type polysaccharide/polyol phosphate transport system ATPase subunit
VPARRGTGCYRQAVSAIVSAKRPADREPGARAARPAVAVRHLSKSFRLPHEQYHTIKERALHPFRSRSYDLLEAVQDVSLEIAPGEFFGIVGRNGSGKSTLLKCLAGIYGIDQGDINIEGRLSPFIELGVGFNMDLTARDNVIINAIMLGLSRKQAHERFDDIIAFATAVQVDADILLIDEVLAVGDANFQQKCFDEFTRLHEAGRTILFVTHDMGAVERFCNRAMLLEYGRVVDVGDPTSIARQYNQHNFRRSRLESGAPQHEIPPENPPAEVLNARFETGTGEVAVTSTQGESCLVRMEVRFAEDLENPIFAITLLNEAGQPVFITNTDSQHISTGKFAAGTEATIDMRFDNWLAPGRYRLVATVARAGLGADIFDAHMINSIIVIGDKPGGGITDLPHTLEIERR